MKPLPRKWKLKVCVLSGAMLIGATFTFLAVRLTTSHGTGALPQLQPAMVGSLPTIARPLAPWAKQIPLGQASATLGGSITLPDSELVKPSDTGPVWAASLRDPDTGESSTTVALTYPAQSVTIRFTRPVAYPDALANYAGFARDNPGLARVLDLNGVAALAIKQNSDDLGSNFGSIEFVAAGTRIVVMGHYDESVLRDVALSILNRTGS